MIRTPAMFRLMLRLALVAVLLMSIAPTISRVLAAAHSGPKPILMELCTSAGLKLVDVSSFIGTEEPGTTVHSAADAACGYCLLAMPLPLLLLALVVLLFRQVQTPCLPCAIPSLRSPRNRRGIGSQGPPLVL